MKLVVSALLAVPLVAMVFGFLVAVRQLSRRAAVRGIDFAPDGARVIRFAPGAALKSRSADGLRGSGLPVGSGTLMLTEREIVFERFFPRRELRIALGALREARAVGAGADRGSVVVRWDRGGGGEVEAALSVPDPDGWLAAIRAAGASPPRAPEAAVRSPGS